MDLDSWYSRILEAKDRINKYVYHTPLEYSHDLSLLSEGKCTHAFLKLESEQSTGSFKVRGAFNKLKILLDNPKTAGDIKSRGPITASSGNHALATLHAMKTLGLKGTIYTATTVSPVKEQSLLARGAELIKVGEDCVEGELAGRQASIDSGRVFISPYNDVDIIAGQGTIGAEILEDLPDVDVVMVSVGGGGLIGGIAAYLKKMKPSVKIIGCQPQMSKVMYESTKAGKFVHEESYDTLSDGTAGDVEDGAITLSLCCKYVDDWILVDEEEIAKGVFFMLDKHHKIVEGAAGVCIASYLKNIKDFAGKNVVLVMCGANISTDRIRQIIYKCGN